VNILLDLSVASNVNKESQVVLFELFFITVCYNSFKLYSLHP